MFLEVLRESHKVPFMLKSTFILVWKVVHRTSED